jgi:hypothetical protein
MEFFNKYFSLLKSAFRTLYKIGDLNSHFRTSESGIQWIFGDAYFFFAHVQVLAANLDRQKRTSL